MRLTSQQKHEEFWATNSLAWQDSLPTLLRTNSSTVLVECCAADGGIASLPTYFAAYDKRLQSLGHLGALASVRFWLAHTERVRALPHVEPVLAWLRECFDPVTYPWFGEAFVPPQANH